ncbi:venom protease-like [Portunus trituberculatus]|uniref:venom protease-like n=1 Tax=Portunus trituberculatus TaxID=210409 RepID=UPI001E1CD3F7|nr:venom protease-like [Portunus trituberculatus]
MQTVLCVIFPGEDVRVTSAAPAVINPSDNRNTALEDDRIYFPDVIITRPPAITSTTTTTTTPTTTTATTTTTTRPSGDGLQPVRSPNPSPRPSHSPVSSHNQSVPSSVPSSIIPSECGKSMFDSRVVGGTVTEPGEWPWLAALGRMSRGRFSNLCGGSLFTVRHVLSAEHCFISLFVPNIVRLGEYDVTRFDEVPGTQDFGILERHNKQYKSQTYENDIVIIVLDRDVVFTDYIRPVCLPFNERGNNFANEKLIIVGWGKTDYETSSYTDVPFDAIVPVVDREQCAQSYKRAGNRRVKPVVDERHLCAGNGTKDSCSGDSGGPLHHVSLNDGRFYIVGIVSFGFECASADYPGVYTRVTTFLDWIMEVVQ